MNIDKHAINIKRSKLMEDDKIMCLMKAGILSRECFEINKRQLEVLDVVSLDFEYAFIRRVARQQVVNEMKSGALHGAVSEETDKMIGKWVTQSLLMSLVEDDEL